MAVAAPPPPSSPDIRLDAPAERTLAHSAAGSDRRADVDLKQQRIAELLGRVGCEGLLILDQANLAWLTSGAVARCILDPAQLPALYFTATQRWLLAANYESQRMFDAELDGLGFMLKEWPWHWGREQLLADLCHGRSVAADVPFRDTKTVGDQLRSMRRILTPYEQTCALLLGQVVVHAVEATCRGAVPGDTERELAGQVAHRLVHRGAVPAAISVAGDGQSRPHRRHWITPNPVHRFAVVAATARKFGLHATAARAFSFGRPPDEFRKEHQTACKLLATYGVSTWPDAGLREILAAGRRVFAVSGYEYEWQLCPQGYLTGRFPVEQTILPDTADRLQAGHCVVWWPTVGAAACAETLIVSPAGPQVVTPTESWPLVSVRVSGAEFVAPLILER